MSLSLGQTLPALVVRSQRLKSWRCVLVLLPAFKVWPHYSPLLNSWAGFLAVAVVKASEVPLVAMCLSACRSELPTLKGNTYYNTLYTLN